MMNAILIFGTRYTEISICSAYMSKKVSPHEYNPAINKGLIYMKIINNSIGKLNCRLMYTAPRTNKFSYRVIYDFHIKIINNSIGKLNCRIMYNAPRTNNSYLTR